MADGIGITQEYNLPPYFGIGRIMIPKGVDRNKFVSQCYRLRQVSIILNTGSMIKKCNITEEAINHIKFPNTPNSLGSEVVFSTDKFKSTPIITGVLSEISERTYLNEGEFHLSKRVGGSSFDIFASREGKIILKVEGENSEINLLSNGENSKVNLKCDGDINILDADNLNFKIRGSNTLEILDNDSNQVYSFKVDSGGVVVLNSEGEEILNINEDSFKLFSGGSPISKGDELKKQLETTNSYLTTLLNALNTTFTGLNAVAPGTSVAFSTAMADGVKGDFSKINSEKSFTE